MRSHADEKMRELLSEWPVDRPARWNAVLNEPQPKAQVQAVQESIRRNCPFGGDRWVQKTAEKLNLAHTLRPPGRPKKSTKSRGNGRDERQMIER
jgi:hypothetical protein